MPIDKSKIIISVNNLSLSYGDNQILKDVDLHIHEGDFIGIIGPNGGGKTTLIKTILGLIKPQKGTIRILGKLQNDFSDWSKIGYVAQRVTNFDSKFPVTVQDVVAMGLIGQKGILKPLNKNDKVLIEEALLQVNMLEQKNQLIGSLSGGQQQRAFIARSLISSPKIIILDEPTTGVDIKSQEDFYKILKHLNHDLGITIILISHDIDVITKEVSTVACVNQTLVYHGSPKHFEEQAKIDDLYSKDFKRVVHHHD